MARGTGKTRVIQELASNVSGRVPVAFDSVLVNTWVLFTCLSKIRTSPEEQPIGLRTFSTLFGRYIWVNCQ